MNEVHAKERYLNSTCYSEATTGRLFRRPIRLQNKKLPGSVSPRHAVNKSHFTIIAEEFNLSPKGAMHRHHLNVSGIVERNGRLNLHNPILKIHEPGFFLAVGSSGLCAALLLLVLVYGLYSLYSKGRKKNEETRLILQPFDDPDRAAIPDPVLVHQQLR
ncbi:hypothetical protein LSH36_320g07018 [Paralvinella palmiformis]|uniref:Uncharacterized protein n=1 Tax=Paralvinella palmiformis TaxID=53620 RepID=A0AAD9JGY5_9ANNE|nr:hypothetical protein LSH36_320g07018 [Paralvinella palmiformis]